MLCCRDVTCNVPPHKQIFCYKFEFQISDSTMVNRLKIIITFFCILYFSGSEYLHAQILKDTASVNSIKKGINYVYNFKFSKAEEIFNNLNKSFKGNPVMYLLDGMLTYWKNYPLLPASNARNVFEENLRMCMELCEKNKNQDVEAEDLLTSLCARGFLLLFYTDNELNIEVFPLATSTYPFIRRSFDLTSLYSDFYFFTGVYNYYTEVYPKEYPIYKPLALLFKKGDRIKGLNELQIAAGNSIFLKAESLSFLSEIYLTFENNFQRATDFSKKLYELYPDNLEYLGTYIKNLLLVKQYDEAERLIASSSINNTSAFFTAEMAILTGIIKEKKYHDYSEARKLYINGIRDISPYGHYGNEFSAYAYFGLSRISEAERDLNYKKVYLKMALKLADFKNITFN
jgi:hypothetical protein